MTTDKPQHIEQAEGLRALADMIEATPEIRAEYLSGDFGINVWHSATAEGLAAIARAALKHGAKVDKDVFGDMYNLTISWGAFNAKALGQRANVCTRVQVGTETVVTKVPDPVALAEVPEVEITEEVPVFDWECKPILSIADGSA